MQKIKNEKVKIDDLLSSAIEAGSEILDIYRKNLSITYKSDGSPVTNADVLAENIIRKKISSIYNDIQIVGEETNSIYDYKCESRFIHVDALDGTKEFINGDKDFTVNIAVIDNFDPIAGVVYAPAIGRIWWGCYRFGAYAANVVEKKIENICKLKTKKACKEMIAVGSRSHGSPETLKWLSDNNINHVINRGSSLKFCIIAEGKADVYPRFGRTMEWDTAAGDAILRIAGGIVIDIHGNPLKYGKTAQIDENDFANPWFIAFGDADAARKLKYKRDLTNKNN